MKLKQKKDIPLMSFKNKGAKALYSLIFVAGTLFISSCNKELVQRDALNPDLAAQGANLDSIELLLLENRYANNLFMSPKEIAQFLRDLKDPQTASKVKNLYENTLNTALSYQPVGYPNLDGDAGNQAARAAYYLNALTLGWLATSDSNLKNLYLSKSTAIFKAWASANNITGYHKPSEPSFLPFYETYSLLRKHISDSDRAIIDGWFRKRLTVGRYALLEPNADVVNRLNNWEAIRLLFLFYSGYALGDTTIINRAKTEYNTFLDNYLLDSRGVTYDFYQRDALVYHEYGLKYVAEIGASVLLMEGSQKGAEFISKKNKYGYSIKEAYFNFWPPYLMGKYHYDFELTREGSDIPRKGKYDPKGGFAKATLDQMHRIFPDQTASYIPLIAPGEDRFANLTTYRQMLGKPNPSIAPIAIDTIGNPYYNSPLVNIAKGKVSKQSSTNPTYNAGSERAVDGNTSGIWENNSVTYTNDDNGKYKWWEVDLGSMAGNITEVRVHNIIDNKYTYNLERYYLFISDTPITGNTLAEIKAQPGVTTILTNSVPKYMSRIPVNRSGRYVRIQLDHTGPYPLSLAEVEVMTTK